MTTRRLCAFCKVVELTGRSDQLTCSGKCRQALARFKRDIRAEGHLFAPLRLAYADWPYPGKEHYYEEHPDYRGAVNYAAVLARLTTYDGWAFSTDEPGLRWLNPLLTNIDHRIGVWVKGERPGPSDEPLNSWEAVVFKPARRYVSRSPAVDSLVFVSRPRTADDARVIGSKPAAFYSWLFGLLSASPLDSFDDLFPGSGGGARAWSTFREMVTMIELRIAGAYFGPDGDDCISGEDAALLLGALVDEDDDTDTDDDDTDTDDDDAEGDE